MERGRIKGRKGKRGKSEGSEKKELGGKEEREERACVLCLKSCLKSEVRFRRMECEL